MANQNIDNNALFKLSYGLFVLSAREGDKDNGCIINTAVQLTVSPLKISIAVNKQNYTHDMIMRTKEFNLSVLSEDALFQVFERFGFKSGRECDKFLGFDGLLRSENGILYLTRFTNSFISAKVIETIDCDSHTLFIAEVTEAKIISNKKKSLTYQYYFDNIKPKPAPKEEKKGFVCKVCGYVYEGEDLPPDFICPICKHGAEDFEPLN